MRQENSTREIKLWQIKALILAMIFKKIDVKLNIPPFLKDQAGFNEGDVLKTQTITQHRIHVERATGKV